MNRDANNQFKSGETDYSVAWVLMLFLGIFGAHRFYMGKIGTGVLYLLTLGLLGFGVIYDLFTLNGQVSERNGETAQGEPVPA
ncbi:MAG: TM2 domain-containing protein, partial [Alcanivorax sp.]|jgi:TM2 domain-containing membrane protein YozV|nr:TM2 domain-containing protein [Alcanivorax sp.]